MAYRLNVYQIDQSCLFELTWGQGRRIPASLPYPTQLTALYQSWRRAYIGYYQQALRGRAAAAGQVAPKTVDWHSQVVQAEARLLSEFHKWLRHEALFELRAELVKGQAPMPQSPSAARMELFLSCSPLEMARLPWETWEVGADLGQQSQIQIVRSPSTIRSATPVSRQPHRRKARVLAILGDEQGLNFEGDRQALDAQKKQLEVHYVGWQPGENAQALREKICQTIADPWGWDVLFFAGHSNEAAFVDGQIAIAPNTALSVRELAPYLVQAKERGLQFTLFNSCSGLDIANGLIDLGLGQVAVMREPIHNDVAYCFLLQFLQRLANAEDAQTALMGACQSLKLEKNLTYPSAHLVPSLFRHPESVPYRIQPVGWQATLRRFRPSKSEAIAVGILTLLSFLPPVHDWLLDRRLAVQARYRNWTGQLASTEPSILLVQIDDRTLQEAQIAVPNPIDRGLLADITTTLTRLDAPVISFDYLLDRPQPEVDPQLRAAFEAAVAQQRWIVLATRPSHLGEWLLASPTVASPNWSLPGDIWAPMWYIRPKGWSSQRPWPFSHQAALAYRLATTPAQDGAIAPNLEQTQPLQAAVGGYLDHTGLEHILLPRSGTLHPITNFSYLLQQNWLQPILDYSMPPHQLYHTVPAWQLLQAPEAVLEELGRTSLEDLLIIVAPGGYDEAGFTQSGEDNLAQPLAVSYWYRQTAAATAPTGFTGGEIHTYTAHHLLSNHLITPVPSPWLLLLAALTGKAMTVFLVPARQRPIRLSGILIGVSLAYGLVSLQLYVSGKILLPWLLPSAMLWFYGTKFNGYQVKRS